MKQCYHTIIKPERNGWFVGWVEEIPGTITHGKSLDECRRNLKDSLQLMLETHRDEARQCLDRSCLQESIEIDVNDPQHESAYI
jgi:predicted RNase H-like HicB family nuclease